MIERTHSSTQRSAKRRTRSQIGQFHDGVTSLTLRKLSASKVWKCGQWMDRTGVSMRLNESGHLSVISDETASMSLSSSPPVMSFIPDSLLIVRPVRTRWTSSAIGCIRTRQARNQ